MRIFSLILIVVLSGCGLDRSSTQQIMPEHKKVVTSTENILPKVFVAIQLVETGSHPNPSQARGDNGELGPYQITRSYYEDAIEHDRSLFGIEYEGVRDFHISRLIMIAYWERYAVEWTAEELCRLHNGGPSKRYTDEYWDKCRQIIK